MTIHPLPKKLYDRLIAAGIYAVHFQWSGGSDEGYLEITFDGATSQALEQACDDWAWEVWDYGGAGDGNDYGDDITYNLGTMTATHGEWRMTREDDGETSESFGLIDEEEDDVCPEIPGTPQPTQREVLQRLVQWACKSDDYVSQELQEILNEAEALVGGVES